jgi:thioredoxin 1
MSARARPIASLPLLILMLLSSASAVWGQEQEQKQEPFTEARFAELQEKEALILVEVFADWCPTCALQQEVLAAYGEAHPDVPLHILTVDFDRQKEWVRHFQAPRQSTFILYRGEERLWFSVAETNAEVIFARLNEAAGSP